MIELNQPFEHFLRDQGFMLQQRTREGRILVYRSGDFELFIGKDNSEQTFIDIRRNGCQDWIQIGLLRSYLLKYEDVFRSIPFEQEARFIMEYFSSITEALQESVYRATMKELWQLEHQDIERLLA
jgi:hypothetical protein